MILATWKPWSRRAASGVTDWSGVRFPTGENRYVTVCHTQEQGQVYGDTS